MDVSIAAAVVVSSFVGRFSEGSAVELVTASVSAVFSDSAVVIGRFVVSGVEIPSGSVVVVGGGGVGGMKPSGTSLTKNFSVCGSEPYIVIFIGTLGGLPVMTIWPASRIKISA